MFASAYIPIFAADKRLNEKAEQVETRRGPKLVETRRVQWGGGRLWDIASS